MTSSNYTSRRLFPVWLATLLVTLSCESTIPVTTLISPSGHNFISFSLDEQGGAYYVVKHKEKEVISSSKLGFELLNDNNLNKNFKIQSSEISTFSETWEQPWGEKQFIENNYNELTVHLVEKGASARKLDIIFRAYDDGIAFRYHFPKQPNLTDFVITSEVTQFQMTGDHTAWWIPANYDSYEHLYKQTPISQIDATDQVNAALASVSIPVMNATHTPLTMKTADGLHISIHEADITDYAGMTLRSEPGNLLECDLVPWKDGTKVKAKSPFSSPWRTIQIAQTPAELLESSLIINLNKPNSLGDVSWVKPMKYVGIWWGMHLGKQTWEMGPNHGATTTNAKKYIDFAAENGFGGVLIEGWNIGWDRKEPFDYTKAYPDFDLEEVVAYGKSRGVSLIGHHETYGALSHYETQLDSAWNMYGKLGVIGVKTGYVGKLQPDLEWHHGQWFVRHFQRVIDKAAEQKMVVVAHEPIKPSGKRRTYPNMIAREGVRGSEFNSTWGGGNPPEHLTIVPFTRMLAGPIDYTPGIFKLDLSEYKPGYKVPTTLAYQLAEYVVIYSPVQMASDLPEHYALYPDAFEFIKQVGVDWEDSKVLDAEIGDYVAIARKERGTGNWFIGALTDENSREMTINFDFLDEGVTYEVTIYKDSEEADFETNQESYEIISDLKLTQSDKIDVRLARGGGVGISLIKTED